MYMYGSLVLVRICIYTLFLTVMIFHVCVYDILII